MAMLSRTALASEPSIAFASAEIVLLDRLVPDAGLACPHGVIRVQC